MISYPPARGIALGPSFCYPAQPSVGITVPSGADDFGAWVELDASTAAAIFITKIIVDPSSLTTATYLTVQIGTGTVTVVWEEPIDVTASTSQGAGGPLRLLVPIPTATRLIVRTAGNVILSPKITLQAIADSNVGAL